MSSAAGESRRLTAETASAAWPVLALVAVAGCCWAVTVARMRGMDMGPGTPLGGFGWFAVVWVTMMAAMMLPSLSPMAVAYSRTAGGGRARSLSGTVVFAAGYLLPWSAFGVLAYGAVDGGRSLDLGALAWDRAGRYVAGGVILGAALYELTAAKGSCLRRCRDAELLRERPGAGGALLMGMEQGAFCVGCSGALMAALFALGVMSVAWMLAIAALVAIEKLSPWPAASVGLTAAALAALGLAVVLVPEHVPWLTIPMSM
jgi:predicted metal-binding membrane protein